MKWLADYVIYAEKNGSYAFKAPPVCTARWDAPAWLHFAGTIRHPETKEIMIEAKPHTWLTK